MTRVALDGKVHLTHPDTGGEFLSPDDDAVIAMWTARGWVVSPAIPEHLDPDAGNSGAVPVLAAEPAAEDADQDDAGEQGADQTTEAAVAEVNTTKEKNRA